MNVGDRVRVKHEVMVFHFPKKKNEPVDIQGYEGEVVKVLTEWQGRPVSANFPVCVQFDIDPKFLTHMREDELESLT
ncbi:MAG: ferredoxin--nitrite reductase [Synechococcales cyanobacterium RU_4_20]|nr:ferredoxin--nitrite reductase [Synechococcales cyanobacterium RU_4_20]NJR68167.1 ferredoxin--nitrite reductase [Synechococcales cyanobacterium CRU_2_2]